MRRLISFAVIALTTASLTGCPGPVEFINMGIAASDDAETPESVGLAPANFRGKTCLELAVDRKNSDILISHTGEHADYVQKHGRWTHASIEQVEREQGCMVGTTLKQAGAIDYILKHPESLKELESDLPPGGLEYIKAGGKLPASAYVAQPAATSLVPATKLQPSNVGPWGSISLTGYPQTSLAQWIARETPGAYQGKSCEYLHIALVRSEQMMELSEDEPKAWGLSKKKAISQVLSNRDCPPPTPYLIGRTGAWITPIDPVKAPRLGLPFAGASVEKLQPGGPALLAGVQFADVIAAVNGVQIGDDVDFLVAINKVPTGSTALLQIWRKGGYVTAPLVLGPPTGVRTADLSTLSKSAPPVN